MPTYREPSGLAMSSRNRYLSAEEKQQAAGLYLVLKKAEKQLRSGKNNFREIEAQAKAELKEQKFKVEYFTICNQDNLSPAENDDKKLVVLAATKFRTPRLIDNIIVDLTTPL